MTEQEETISRRRHFAQVPDALVVDLSVSGHAVRIWARLDRYAGRTGGAMPSRELLATDLGLSVATVKRSLGELAASGWISRERLGTSNVWRTILNDEARPGDDSGPGRGRPPMGGTLTRERVTGDHLPSDPATGKGSPVTRKRVTGDPRNGSPVTRPRKDRSTDRETEPSTAPFGAGDGELSLDVEGTGPSAGDAVQVLVGAYVESVRASGGIATTSQCSAIGSNVKRLIKDDQIPLPVLLVAVQRAGARRSRTVDPFLGDVQASYGGSEAKRKAMFDHWADLARQDEARRAAS